MTVADLVAVIVVISSIAAVSVLIVALWALLRVLRRVEDTLEGLRQESLPAVRELRDLVGAADVELERVEGLLDTAESVADAAESAAETTETLTRLTRLLVIGPVVRLVALTRGVGRGVLRLAGGRRRRSSELTAEPERPRLVA